MRQALFTVLLTALLPHASPMALALPHEARVESGAKSAKDALKRGEEFRHSWNLDAAESAFREAAALDPRSLEAALGLARIARVRLEYARAINLLDKAAAENPNSVDVLNEYGSVYLAAEEPARARRYFESALQISTANGSAIIGIASVDLLERDHQRATRTLRQYLAREPKSSHAHSMLARVLAECNKNVEAASEAQQAIMLDCFNVEALYILASVKASERNAEEARSLARRVVSLDPFNIGARRLLSQYLDGQRGFEQKVSKQARMHYTRGRMLKQEGKLSEAITELEDALRIEPRYYRALIGLGDVFLRQGDYERAAAAAKLAIAVDPDGASAQHELACAYRGMQERARSEIGGLDFAALFYAQTLPPAYALTRQIFPHYGSLTKRQQTVIDSAVAPLASFLPKLARKKSRHYLLSFDQRPSDLQGFADVAAEKTFDGRYYASIRGVGGRLTVSGIEYLDQAARGGFNTIAHEFAHQVHIAALGKSEVKTIRKLYEKARREGRVLDYYAASNEYEYFAQGYEAFVSMLKRPSAGATARHTNGELLLRDPELHKLFVNLTGRRQS